MQSYQNWQNNLTGEGKVYGDDDASTLGAKPEGAKNVCDAT